jgi:uncharacterized membrane protein
MGTSSDFASFAAEDPNGPNGRAILKGSLKGGPEMRAWGVAAAAIVLAALVAPHARADQQSDGCRTPVLSLEPASSTFSPGGSRSLLFVIENPNTAPVENVRALVTTTAPAGWTAAPSLRELTLGPRNVSVSALAVTAPNRGSGAGNGNVTIVVTFVCTSGNVQTSALSSLVVPVGISTLDPPWPLVLGAFLVLAAGIAVLAVRRIRRGVGAWVSQNDRAVAPGRSAKFTFGLENRRARPQRLHVRGVTLPPGWGLHLALELVDLEPGEEKTLWAILRAPPSARPGEVVDVPLVLEETGGRVAAEVRLRAQVVDEERV